MRRREFISLLGSTAAAWPLAARAQRSERIRRVGVLMLYVENDPEGQVRANAFRQELEKLGWTSNSKLKFDYRWGVGDGDWIRSAAAELLTLAPDVLLANGGPAVRAAQQATRTVLSYSSEVPIRWPMASCKASHVPAATSPGSQLWKRA
jgi:putative ABC transport system substrate-binding protein